ncbi:DNA-processing protein DprA [Croceimicrobium sp.]|uniref:DNA-processing protein DprA n=1 Tax=Croceimicrobium sp. TaxID=2828340 RepID=UPI003BAB4B5E
MKFSNEAKAAALALSLMDGIGPVRARKLIAHCGSPEAVFKESKQSLERIPGIGSFLVQEIRRSRKLVEAEKQLSEADNKGWAVHYFEDKAYPRRMRHCEDAPVVLFQKGHTPLNAKRCISIVGTRNMTDYGRDFLHQFLEEAQSLNLLIFSGLAYGVDACAHRKALDNGIVNCAVLAHGLDRIYPALHRKLATEIVEAGGSWLSEFPTGTNPDRENFPKRNRIIAAMSDAVIVVEAARKGGALITAEFANQYNRDVFALPGRIHDPHSEGCNLLIKSHRAYLLEGARDLSYIMRWEAISPMAQKKQLELFENLSPDERLLIDALVPEKESKSLDWLLGKCGITGAQCLRILMSLELKGLLETVPGPRYRLKS